MARDPHERMLQLAEDPIALQAMLAQTRRGRPLTGVLGRPDLGVAGTIVGIAGLGAATVARSQVLRLAGADQQARSIGIVGTATLVDPVPANFIADAFLLVQWGTGGARHSVEVDLGPRGASIVVHGSAVEVSVGWTGSGMLRAAVSAGYAESRPPSAPARTVQAAAIAGAGGTAALLIPAMAAVVRMQRTPNASAYTWAFRRQNATVISDGAVAAGVGEETVRVPPDAADLFITNGGAGAITQFRAIFEVLL